VFDYTDPGGTLRPKAALTNYRNLLHAQYRQFATQARSAFTLLEAFQTVKPAKKSTATVDWLAFPKTATATFAQIDANRQLQDEYVEWRVERTASRITRITFCTDFREYYEAIAMVSKAALVTAIQRVIPGANPANAQLFGAGFNPDTATAEARAFRFRNNLANNPWNNGTRGIFCLTVGVNSIPALFSLTGFAAVPNAAVPAGSICATLGGNCVPGRNSDPSIATAVQTLAKQARGLSLADPVGIQAARLDGVWQVNGTDVDPNDLTANQGIWRVSRGGRRAVLNNVAGLTLDGAPVTSGAQVAAVFKVQAAVISALEADLPDWARIGQETSQRLQDAANAPAAAAARAGGTP